MVTPNVEDPIKVGVLGDGHPIVAMTIQSYVLSHLDHAEWMASAQRKRES